MPAISVDRAWFTARGARVDYVSLTDCDVDLARAAQRDAWAGPARAQLAPLAAGEAAARGLRDDAAFLNIPAGRELVVTTDALVAGVHFMADDPPALALVEPRHRVRVRSRTECALQRRRGGVRAHRPQIEVGPNRRQVDEDQEDENADKDLGLHWVASSVDGTTVSSRVEKLCWETAP